jgi:hypothetical protein
MKMLVMIAAFSIFSITISNAQTWKEWFSQKKTQKEYMVKQIAALEVYLDYLKEGYDIAQKGLAIVGDIKGRNFNDHSEYFTSLKFVNDDLGVTSKVRAIMTCQVAIMTMFRELNRECRNSDYLTREEIQYVDLVYGNLLVECERSIAALNVVVTNEASQMTDEARIARIDEVYADLSDKYGFTRSFGNSTRMLMMQRAAERNEVEAVKKLNDML